MSPKPFVLVAGATGRTGIVVIQGLLKSGNFRVAALVRKSSLNKPIVKEFESSGVEIRVGDISEPSDKLATYLEGVDTLILLVLAMVDQKPVLLEAKKAGVKRVVPSDFGPPVPRGVMMLNDAKLDIREFIKEHDIPHTFNDVGLWMEIMFPYSHKLESDLNSNEKSMNDFKGSGNVKVALTAYSAVGDFTARIIADRRTLNKAVMTWDVEATLNETWKVAESVSGEDFSKNRRLTDEEIRKMAESDDIHEKILGQHYLAVLLRGDSTVPKALAFGDLNARELYPDYKPATLEEEARKCYANPPRFKEKSSLVNEQVNDSGFSAYDITMGQYRSNHGEIRPKDDIDIFKSDNG